MTDDVTRQALTRRQVEVERPDFCDRYGSTSAFENAGQAAQSMHRVAVGSAATRSRSNLTTANRADHPPALFQLPASHDECLTVLTRLSQ